MEFIFRTYVQVTASRRDLPDGRRRPSQKKGPSRRPALAGGVGLRRSSVETTKTGRPRAAPRWSTAAALAFSEAVDAFADRAAGARADILRGLLGTLGEAAILLWANRERAAVEGDLPHPLSVVIIG